MIELTKKPFEKKLKDTNKLWETMGKSKEKYVKSNLDPKVHYI